MSSFACVLAAGLHMLCFAVRAAAAAAATLEHSSLTPPVALPSHPRAVQHGYFAVPVPPGCQAQHHDHLPEWHLATRLSRPPAPKGQLFRVLRQGDKIRTVGCATDQLPATRLRARRVI